MKLIDSHCHIDDDRLDAIRPQVMERAGEKGIERIIVPATTALRWQKIKTLCDTEPRLLPCYGLHPMFMQEHTRNDLVLLEQWLTAEKPVALGECGLDFFAGSEDEQWQIELFAGQIELASQFGLPLIVHARKSLDRVISLLRRHSHHGGVIHSFSGSEQQASQLLDLGFYLGISATVSFERARRLRQVVSRVPIDRLLIESDAPDQPGYAHRGELNEPAFIVDHLSTMAELRQVDEASMANILNQNCARLFGLPAVVA